MKKTPRLAGRPETKSETRVRVDAEATSSAHPYRSIEAVDAALSNVDPREAPDRILHVLRLLRQMADIGAFALIPRDRAAQTLVILAEQQEFHEQLAATEDTRYKAVLGIALAVLGVVAKVADPWMLVVAIAAQFPVAVWCLSGIDEARKHGRIARECSELAKSAREAQKSAQVGPDAGKALEPVAQAVQSWINDEERRQKR